MCLGAQSFRLTTRLLKLPPQTAMLYIKFIESVNSCEILDPHNLLPPPAGEWLAGFRDLRGLELSDILLNSVCYCG